MLLFNQLYQTEGSSFKEGEAIAIRLEAEKKLLGTSASLLVTSALLVVTRSY